MSINRLCWQVLGSDFLHVSQLFFFCCFAPCGVHLLNWWELLNSWLDCASNCSQPSSNCLYCIGKVIVALELFFLSNHPVSVISISCCGLWLLFYTIMTAVYGLNASQLSPTQGRETSKLISTSTHVRRPCSKCNAVVVSHKVVLLPVIDASKRMGLSHPFLYYFTNDCKLLYIK